MVSNFLTDFKNIFSEVTVDSTEDNRLPTENELVEKLDQSYKKSVINYHTRRLRDSGIIEGTRRAGSRFVSDKSKALCNSLTVLIEQLSTLGYIGTDAINETRKNFEISLFNLFNCLPNYMQHDILDQLHDVVQKMEYCVSSQSDESINELIDLDTEFHEKLDSIAYINNKDNLMYYLAKALYDVQRDNIEVFWKNATLTEKKLLVHYHDKIYLSLKKAAYVYSVEQIREDDNKIENIDDIDIDTILTDDMLKSTEIINHVKFKFTFEQAEVYKKENLNEVKESYQNAVATHYGISKIVLTRLS